MTPYGNIIKQIRGGMCVLCNVISERKPLIPNRCVLRIPAVNYMCNLWSDFIPTLLGQILYITFTHKCHTNTCLILNDYGVTDTAHYAQYVHLKSNVGVHKFPHFSRHAIQFLVNKTNRCTELQFYWYYNSTCFGQKGCPKHVEL